MKRSKRSQPKQKIAVKTKLSRPAASATATRFKAAFVLHQNGRWDEAGARYREILRSQPQHFDSLRLLATIAAQRKDSASAIELFDQALRIRPDHASSLNHRGNVLLDLKRHDEALTSYDRSLQLEPDCAEAHFNRANALLEWEYHERGSEQTALELYCRGYPSGDRERHEQALQSYRRALELEPNYVEAWFNCGNALHELNRPKEALRSYVRAITLQPAHAAAHFNRGNVLIDLHRHRAALRSYQRALELKPDDAQFHLNRAFVWLLLGDFTRGWPENEWRWKRPDFPLPEFAQPRWKGEPLRGRTLLLHWEQGLGDTLQFVRYAPLLQRQGARVVICCQKPLVKLMKRCEGIDEVVADGEPLPAFDYWTPLMSVPTVMRTDHCSIPGECSYITADPALVTHWKNRLAKFPGYRIGIAWQGSPDHQADRQRSTPLRFFAALARIPGVRLISLQKGPGAAQLAEIAGSFEPVQFDDLDMKHGAFMDTAAIMRNVDLVVCCDSSLVHLAGALGVPAWLPLKFAPDWRWMLNRDDSPWYPSMRLFRQQALGEWGGVFERMAREIRARLPSG